MKTAIPDRPALRHLANVRFHRPVDGIHLLPQRRSGIACTNILRTMCDLGAVDRAAVVGAVGHVLTLKLATLDALEMTVLAHSTQGRAGITALRAAIDEWSIDAKPADSVLEPAMRRLARRYALPPLDFHPVVDGWEVDFRVRETSIILECDGWTSHGLHHQQFERDRERDARLTVAGWIVLRFTYRSITRSPGRVATRIRGALDRWSMVQPPDAA
jgi:very-short-patch-repair endonuclease